MNHVTVRLNKSKTIPLLLQLAQFGIFLFLFLRLEDVWKEHMELGVALAVLYLAVCLFQIAVIKMQTGTVEDHLAECSGTVQPVSEEERRRLFAEHVGLTDRELEVFERLITTEEGVQEIADELYISRRNLQRHIASIYEKTGTKSRIGLFQIYAGFKSQAEHK